MAAVPDDDTITLVSQVSAFRVVQANSMQGAFQAEFACFILLTFCAGGQAIRNPQIGRQHVSTYFYNDGRWR